MKILIFNWRDPKNPKAGGAEVATLHHALGWIRAGHDVTWFSASFPHAKSYEIYQGIQIYRKGNQATVYLRAFLFYQKMKNKIDLVVDEVHGLPFFTPLYVSKPKIAFINEVAGVIWDATFPFPIGMIGRYAEPFILRLYKQVPIMTGSESAKKDLLKLGFLHTNIHVIHHGLEMQFVPRSINKEQKPTFLFVNRLVKMKGIEDVISAFALIVASLPNAQLWIVGRGENEYVMRLQKKVKQLGLEKNIAFLGYVSAHEKFVLYKKAHVLLHASVKEGWGLNVIEAASQETPTIAYKVGGLVDSIQDGITGILTKKNTSGQLAHESIQIIENPLHYAKMQKGALAYSKTFSWKKSIKESLQLLNTVQK